MFNLYSNMQRRKESDCNEKRNEPKEAETTGHDRFYQRPSRQESTQLILSKLFSCPQKYNKNDINIIARNQYYTIILNYVRFVIYSRSCEKAIFTF